ncbi:hypothetical protein Taro_012799 [Colocasia esculenta]|uniref:Uncharacterized protein n=1 Tax=Colocasia esculenta TaxID=4460 RepID=A0A843UGR0_COLES|nr:hypothetical protein [Colocasia esculenta]
MAPLSSRSIASSMATTAVALMILALLLCPAESRNCGRRSPQLTGVDAGRGRIAREAGRFAPPSPTANRPRESPGGVP